MTKVPKEIMDLEKKESQNLVQKKEQKNDIRRGDKMANPYMGQKFDPYG